MQYFGEGKPSQSRRWVMSETKIYIGNVVMFLAVTVTLVAAIIAS